MAFLFIQKTDTFLKFVFYTENERKESYYETFKSIRFPTQIYSPHYYGIRPYSLFFLTIQAKSPFGLL